tara:strand:- start:4652 stop:4888 length:237 start_codon:yes stop_codon:yes gene_type:complete
MLRLSNEGVSVKGSIQITDEYPCTEVFPNSHNAENYEAWCAEECKRIGKGCFIYYSLKSIGDVNDIKCCHIRRTVDVG